MQNEYIEQYFNKYPSYRKLAESLRTSIKEFLDEMEIGYVDINSRVKKFEDFLEKVERKKYKTPFEEMEDICGIRIVCYFNKDIKEIAKIIEKEFKVLEIVNKEDELEATQFGYRSRHYIATIKKDWRKAPNYRGLEDLKFEIQIRTILMNAWAEIEHKLAYKKFEHMPKQFRRKFSLLSAKLEEADEQFEDLMNKIYDYKNEIKNNKIQDSESMNLESLTYLLERNYPNKMRKVGRVRETLDQLIEKGVSNRDLELFLEANKDRVKEKDFVENVIKKGK